MKHYYVTIPVATSICVEVEAEEITNEKQAYRLAVEVLENTDTWIDLTNDSVAELGETAYLDHIVEGNVCHAPCWSVEYQENED